MKIQLIANKKSTQITFFFLTAWTILVFGNLNSTLFGQSPPKPLPEGGQEAPVFEQPPEENQQLPVSEEGLTENGEAVQADESTSSDGESVWTFITKGGPTMIALAIISTIIIAFSLERFFFFRRQKVTTKGYHDRVIRALEDGGVEALNNEIKHDDLLLSRILRAGLFYRQEGSERVEKAIETEASVEIGRLEKGLNLLNNLGNLAPLVGFFGTVTGMRNSFLQFVEKAAPTARDLAGGVEEALITTITGLLIAIPAYFVYNLFIYYIDSLSIELEKNAATILSKMK